MYHLSVKPISRAAGRSATAAAAYRSGTEIVDDRSGEAHDYRRKRDIVHSEIVLPPGSPAWAEDRSALWNAAEAAEKRKDARVARDYEVAIPKALSLAQGVELVRDFSYDLSERYGIAVDFNVHRDDLKAWDGSEKGWQGYHAHILTSTRKLGREGFGEKAEPELSDAKRKSLGLGDGASEVARVRERWEVIANRHLEQANQTQRIDRRSLKDQGLAREPTIHLGPHATGLERDGIPSRLGDINRQVAANEWVRVGWQQIKAEQAERRRAERLVEKAPRAPSAERVEAVAEFSVQDVKAMVYEAMAQLVKERDLRVQRVLERTQQREARREQAHQAMQQQTPAVLQGSFIDIPRGGLRQALEAWDAAIKAAQALAEQAKRLVGRLLEAATPQRLAAWSQEYLKQREPELVARHGRVLAGEQAACQVKEREKDNAVEVVAKAIPALQARPQRSAERAAWPVSLEAAVVGTTGRLPKRGAAPTAPGQTFEQRVADGKAAFRARFEQDQRRKQAEQAEQAERARVAAEQASERLRAAAEAEQRRATLERQRDLELERQRQQQRDRSRSGPSYGR